MRKPPDPPEGYSLIPPGDEQVWMDGDLWWTYDGRWEDATQWLGITVRGLGARPKH